MSADAVEERVRQRVEAELAERLSRRETPRLGLEDQEWVYQLVGRAVAAEHEGGAALGAAEGQEVWRRVFGSVTPLGPLAEHLADPSVEEVRINGTGACFVLRKGAKQYHLVRIRR